MDTTVIKKANTLIEAIPYIHSFRKKLFVIKFGGSILENANIRKNIFEDLVFLSYVGIYTVLVHGGGPHINARLKEEGIKSEFYNGLRVTDEKTLSVVKSEFEKLNSQIVKEIKDLRGDVTGLKGHEKIINAQKLKSKKDLGFVGNVVSIDEATLKKHFKQGHITVVSPMGISKDKQLYNINADEVASSIANKMSAEKLVLLTNVQGVMRNETDPESLISTLTMGEIDDLIKINVISGGMIPKVQSCINALKAGVKKTHILDARIPHALLLEFFTNKGIGTQILHG